jgi:hypothetical protein
MWSSDYFKCNNSKLVALMLVCCQINKNNTCVYTIATRLTPHHLKFMVYLFPYCLEIGVLTFFFAITSHLILIKEYMIGIYRFYACFLEWIQYYCMVSDCLKLIENIYLVDFQHLQECSITIPWKTNNVFWNVSELNHVD